LGTQQGYVMQRARTVPAAGRAACVKQGEQDTTEHQGAEALAAHVRPCLGPAAHQAQQLLVKGILWLLLLPAETAAGYDTHLA
jgi:hypothetical protein